MQYRFKELVITFVLPWKHLRECLPIIHKPWENSDLPNFNQLVQRFSMMLPSHETFSIYSDVPEGFNPIQDGGKKAPYQFFPFNFYKRGN